MSKQCLCYRPADEKSSFPETWNTFMAERAVVDDPNNLDPSIQQILPYVVIYRDVKEELFLLTYSRGKQSTEGRLIDRRSIGFGGHIDSLPQPGAFYEHLTNEIDRELKEELGLTANKKAVYAALLNATRQNRLLSVMDRNPVDSVHTAIVVYLDFDEVAGDDSFVPEQGHVEDVAWVKLADIVKDDEPSDARLDFNRYETWSQIVIDQLNNTVSEYHQAQVEKQRLMQDFSDNQMLNYINQQTSYHRVLYLPSYDQDSQGYGYINPDHRRFIDMKYVNYESSRDPGMNPICLSPQEVGELAQECDITVYYSDRKVEMVVYVPGTATNAGIADEAFRLAITKHKTKPIEPEDHAKIDEAKLQYLIESDYFDRLYDGNPFKLGNLGRDQMATDKDFFIKAMNARALKGEYSKFVMTIPADDRTIFSATDAGITVYTRAIASGKCEVEFDLSGRIDPRLNHCVIDCNNPCMSDRGLDRLSYVFDIAPSQGKFILTDVQVFN